MQVLALGFFDGVHLGHAALFKQTKARATALGASPCVLTFDIHPEQIISKTSIPLINSTADRLDLIRRLHGIEQIVVLPFDQALCEMDRLDFIHMLVSRYRATHFVVGHDFRFGCHAAGDAAFLRKACANLGLGCDIVEEVTLDGAAVKSSAIRKLLKSGELARANQFLGHAHCLTAVVQHGQKRGRTMGTPTINMMPAPNVLMPARGVYATRVFLGQSDRAYLSATNVGIRPTIGGVSREIIETHVLDFTGNLYGHTIRLEFVQFIRPEIKFCDLDALQAQIQADIQAIRTV